MSGYASAANVLQDVAEIAKPPRRMSVPDAAAEYVVLDIPGGYSGSWDSKIVHYLIEPAECLTRRDTDAVIFVGPAQSAKTQMLVDNWVAHTITCDPTDHMVVQPSQLSASDYSKRRISRLLRSSPRLKKHLIPGHGDNVHDKSFRAGNLLNITWPTKNQLSGKAIPKMALTDYDRMPEDIDKEGGAFQLSAERTKSFLSRGVIMAESSPSKPSLDHKWKPKTPHEAPPTTGVLGLYNTGDRRRLYGKCTHCGQYFMPEASIDAISIPDVGSIDERSDGAKLICTVGGCMIDQEHERAFRRSGVWLKDGQTITDNGEIHGAGMYSRRKSFWMPGWFAAFATWRGIVASYLYAKDTFDRTADEEALKTVVNANIGGVYLSDAQRNDTRSDDYLANRPRDQTGRFYVPQGVRGLLASVDIQKSRFEIAVWGHGRDNERWLVDRYALRKLSDGTPLNPAAYIEHWDILIDRVINSTYRIGDGRTMRIHATAVDSGGADGVTERAYQWWRRLKRKNLARRVYLVKGEGNSQNSPMVKRTFPDATKRKDRPGGGKGDVPVLLINADKVKDACHTDLQREIAGPGYINFPEWTPGRVFEELNAEHRTDKGWESIARRRNETWDLLVYDRALWRHLGGDGINWDRPPSWLSEWGANSEIVSYGAEELAGIAVVAKQKITVGRQRRGLLR